MYTIGLTGNIATGKTTVANMLADLGAFVIDADKLAHQAMEPGTRVYDDVVARFGPEVVASDGSIDRTALGAIVFADPDALVELERLVHPAVERAILARLGDCDASVAVIEAIKLLEAGLDRLCDAIWVTTCPPQVQAERIVKERGLSREQALQRIDAQSDPAQKVARADVIVHNDGALDELRSEVARAWRAIPRARAQRANRRDLWLQWAVLAVGMTAVLPLGSRLWGWGDWRQWGPLVPACALLAALSVWVIHRS